MRTGLREELLAHLASEIEAVAVEHPRRIAIDGPPAAGKTTLADQLAVVLRARGHEVIRASIEGFLLPRSQRYRRGEHSPEGGDEDSFDFEALHRVLLEPLGLGGSLGFQLAVYDKRADSALPESIRIASTDAILLFDGVFLMRPELMDRWELRIFVSTAFERTLERAKVRDLEVYGSARDVEVRFRTRYKPSQEFYFATVRPIEHAEFIVHNDEPGRPSWVTRAL